jgi:hypothetical protein
MLDLQREARFKMYANNLPQSPEKVQRRWQCSCVRHDTHTQIAVLLDPRTTVMLTACTTFERGKARCTAGRRSLSFIPVFRNNQKTADSHSKTNGENDVHWLRVQIIPNSEQKSLLVKGNGLSRNKQNNK